MTDLAQISRIYRGSSGEATRMLYRDLERMGPMGVIAANLFRACKCSERAKAYRKGPGHKTEAYARKDWSLGNLCKVLQEQDQKGVLPFAWGWALDDELRGLGNPHHHILYIELPTGQVSFHNGQRYEGPDWKGEWDGAKGTAAERICRFAAELFKMEAAS